MADRPPAGEHLASADTTAPLDDVDRARKRRRFWLIYGSAAAVSLVLAATTTAPGPQRLLTVSIVLTAVAGLVTVVPWVRRSPPAADGDVRKFSWGSMIGPPAMIITNDLIRSAGSEDRGFAALPATVAASALLVLPLVMVVDAALRRRRARKLAEQTTEKLSEPPTHRP